MHVCFRNFPFSASPPDCNYPCLFYMSIYYRLILVDYKTFVKGADKERIVIIAWRLDLPDPSSFCTRPSVPDNNPE